MQLGIDSTGDSIYTDNNIQGIVRGKFLVILLLTPNHRIICNFFQKYPAVP